MPIFIYISSKFSAREQGHREYSLASRGRGLANARQMLEPQPKRVGVSWGYS